MDHETEDRYMNLREAAQQPVPEETETDLLGEYFRYIFRLEDWGEATGKLLSYRSGPVHACESGLAARRLADPEARFWYSAMMAEVMVLPYCIAYNAAERDSWIKRIGVMAGLDVAMEKGWIAGYTICWSAGRYPKSPTGLRVRAAEGRRTRSQVLGSLEMHIRLFVDWMKTGPFESLNLDVRHRK